MKILGIAGSARAGNTKILVETALAEAKKIEGIETEFISLHDKEINPCDGCETCHEKKTLCIKSDDVVEILKSMISADAIIVGSPVYIHSVSSHIKMLMDRTNCLFDMETGKSKLMNKIGASISVGQLRQGGQAFVVQAINNFYFAHGMIVVAGVADESYPGVCAWTNYETGEDAVLSDETAIDATKDIGRRVGLLTKVTSKLREKR